MRHAIIEKLKEIERTENVLILHAVESGSRAWGFESPDSDYDVRFFYLRPKEHYLQLDRKRDVLEYPIHDVWDFSGWDMDKTLRLLHSSNPTLFEWSNSPIVYQTTPQFELLLPVIQQYFISKPALWHYLSMAQGNYCEYLKGSVVKAKKYFYVIRPILACRWILQQGTPPPMLFAALVETQLEEDLKPVVNDLLQLKMVTPEIGEIPSIPLLNEFIEKNLELIKERIGALPQEPVRPWDPLNRLFLTLLENS